MSLVRRRKISLRSRSASNWSIRSWHLAAELADLRLEPGRDVLEDPADLEVAGMHPLPGRHLEQVEDRVALAEAVPEQRDRAEIEGRGAEPDQVRHDPVELQVEHPQVLGAVGDLQLEQPLDTAAEGLHVEEVGEVVHPLDERDRLPVALVLAGLLDPGVEVADHRLQVEDLLAPQGDDQAEHPVGGGVVRPHVDRHHLLLDVPCLLHGHRVDHRRHRVLGEPIDPALGDHLVSERLVAITRTSEGSRPRCGCRGPARRRSGSRGAGASRRSPPASGSGAGPDGPGRRSRRSRRPRAPGSRRSGRARRRRGSRAGRREPLPAAGSASRAFTRIRSTRSRQRSS